ncbi:hypothetical protein FNF27_03436 [Cafeteria roenbergensis]|uniref:Uncharacterized protein n=1 Tax=Cafeteria roenbergensis TaxID=33653 RepID=A0A5A8ECX1_CAFRO|nr:hypothetical protein FNF27_03436 [Cafeteria roenbergensis]
MASAEARAAVHISKFLAKTEERAEFNQYYYSKDTLSALLASLRELGAVRIAFLSTPSVYFSLTPEERKLSYVFDLDDEQFGSDPRFVKYDFNQPLGFPSELTGAFDAVVIDPPFITREVWEKYTETARALLAKDPLAALPAAAPETAPAEEDSSTEADGGAGAAAGAEPAEPAAAAAAAAASTRGLVLLSTIAENRAMMKELLGVEPTRFRPCIPNLVYQYDLYANYPSPALAVKNAEVPDPDDD